MSAFNAPFVSVNTTSWGPSTLPSQFENIPYAPFAKSDGLGKCADFTANSQMRVMKKGRRVDESQANSEFQYKIDSAEARSFVLVDTVKAANKNANSFKRKTFQRKNMLPARGAKGAQETVDRRNLPQRSKYAKQRAQNLSGAGGKKRFDTRWNRVDRQASVKIQSDWKVIEEFDLAQLTKLKANAPDVEDLMWCGFLDTYNDAYDKVNTKDSRPLRRMENKEFYPISTTDDPVIEKFAIENAGNVFATDAILSHLMASPRSVYPWDIIVQKLPNGALFFDKRDNSQFDFVTVSETAHEPPHAAEDNPDDINTPERLSLEATMINQNFSQQILRPASKENRKVYEQPNPFFDDEESEGMEPASVGFRYRKFTLGGIQLVCRCELHGVVVKKGVTGSTEQLMTAYALNEWDGKESGGIEWRKTIDTQKGSVLATELKNNACKLARWSAQSIIAGAEQMKIGYVSRAAKSNPYDHVVIATQSFRPQDFATQINMTLHNMWGIIKMLVELMQKQEEGKYVLLRDPNKPVVRLYSVPLSFNEEEDDDEEDEEGEGMGEADEE
jgi:translation initiation factor 3 subunit D